MEKRLNDGNKSEQVALSSLGGLSALFQMLKLDGEIQLDLEYLTKNDELIKRALLRAIYREKCRIVDVFSIRNDTYFWGWQLPDVIQLSALENDLSKCLIFLDTLKTLLSSSQLKHLNYSTDEIVCNYSAKNNQKVLDRVFG